MYIYMCGESLYVAMLVSDTIMLHLISDSLYLFVVATIGFIGAPYYVNESSGTATLTIGLINGIIDVSVSLNVQLQDGSAVGMAIVTLDLDY